MAYMNQAKKQKINAVLKPIAQKFGIKYSLKCSNHSITMTISSGPVDYFAELPTVDLDRDAHGAERRAWLMKDRHMDLNHYHPHFYGPKLQKLLAAILPAFQVENWNRSDAMTDYFDVGYYYHIQLGKWNKPYTTA